MRLYSMLLAAVFVLLMLILPAAAQSVETITIGGAVVGSVTDAVPAPSYFFDADSGQIVTIRLETTTSGFNPVVLLADANNNVIETLSASPGVQIIGGTVALNAAGRYFVQVQGAGGSRGQFQLAILEGDQPLVSPTPTSPPVENTPTQAEPPSILPELTPGNSEQGGVSADNPQQVYAIRPLDTPQVLEARRASGGTLEIALQDDSGTIVGSISALLDGGAFIIPAVGAGETSEYRLIITHAGGGFVANYRLLLAPLNEGDPVIDPNRPIPASVTLPPTLAPTAAPTATPAAPADIDLLLTWDTTQLLVTNVSGVPINISGLAFAGNNRRANPDFWASGNPAFNLYAMPNNACAGFRPLAYPDAPRLTSPCDDLAAWYSADIVYFWSGETFDVYNNGQIVSTCPSVTGTCGIDMPD
ncbi:MAG: PPC domain-containing protein [Anaerolineae bacterium]|nr:PPC domain-containing protein [Anaerolineae bacterium]